MGLEDSSENKEKTTVEKDIKTLIALHHQSQTKESFLEAVRCLCKSKVWVPMAIQMSPEDVARMKNAKKGEKVQPKQQVRMRPDLLKTPDGKLFFPVFSSKEEAPADYRKRFSWAQLPFMECGKQMLKFPNVHALIVNAFSKNLIVSEEIMKLVLSNTPEVRVLKKGAKINLKPLNENGKDEQLRLRAVEFFQSKREIHKAYLSRVENDGVDRYMFVIDAPGAQPQRLFSEMHAAMRTVNPELAVDYAMYPSMKQELENRQWPVCFFANHVGVEQRYDVDTERQVAFRTFVDSEGIVGKYCIDVENDTDSHYLFYADEAQRFEKYLREKYMVADIIGGLKKYLASSEVEKDRSEEAIAALLNVANIHHQEFHYD
jgi:hypothetical protein